jgi:hypothetical protein
MRVQESLVAIAAIGTVIGRRSTPRAVQSRTFRRLRGGRIRHEQRALDARLAAARSNFDAALTLFFRKWRARRVSGTRTFDAPLPSRL